MRFRNSIMVKDRLTVLMIVCILSNLILTVFSMDYLRKMENEMTKMYEQKLLLTHVLYDMKNQLQASNDVSSEHLEQLKTYAFDSKMEYYGKEIRTNPSLELLDEMNGYVLNQASTQLTKHTDDIAFGYRLILSISLILMGCILFFGIQAIRSINKPTRELKELFRLAQHGDFTNYAKYSARDELGETTKYYNIMVADIKELLKTERKSATSATQANSELELNSEQISKGAVHISNSTETMTSSLLYASTQLTENTASVQQVASGIAQISNRMNQIELYVRETVTTAVDGKNIVEQSLLQMQEVEGAMQKATTSIIELNEQSVHISKAVHMIQAVADQTNLLALNASIEAARAGEHGKGFAVVANEVRKLAEQSKQFTKSIASIVANLQNEAVEVRHEMDLVMEMVNKGVGTTVTSSKKFREITSQVQQIGPQMEQVSHIMHEMANHTHAIAQSSVELNNRSEENVASMQQIQNQIAMQKMATTEIHDEIRSIAKNMRSLTHAVERFQV